MNSKIVNWSARILSLLSILFILIMSFDCIGGDYSLKEQLICFVMHNIPTFTLIILIIIAWKWELAGGILFIVAAFAGSILFKVFTGNAAALILIAPILIAGVLFVIKGEVLNRKPE
ncbi:MAG TPA: hypothetical protein PKI35_09275 [Bacteroidales bacterium]|nr:hypothetical protein [Bacteroidales bacterium]